MRGIPVVVFMLAATLSGCIVDEGGTDDLETIFGAGSLTHNENGTLLNGSVLQGRILLGDNASASWSAGAASAVVTHEPVVLQKQDPGPQGGGGVEHELGSLMVNGTLEVSFLRSDQLGSYRVRWNVHPAGPVDPMGVAPNATILRGDQAFTIPVNDFGGWRIVAHIMSGNRMLAATQEAFNASVGADWTVDSSVRPVRVSGAPEPPNYAQMRDEIKVPVTAPGGSLNLRTSFRGTYNPALHGSDVDLGLFDPDEAAIACVAAPSGSTPSAAESTEVLEADLTEMGLHTVMVGAMPNGVPNCGGGSWFYHNSGSVPYRLVVELRF